VSAELVLEGIERTYPGAVEVRALRSVSLVIEEGELISIAGRSGSGKSTLLNVLGLLDRPTDGHYFVRGVDAGGLGEAELTTLRSRQFGFVFQQYHLMPDRTALENTELGLLYRAVPRQHRRAQAREALVRVGLEHRLNALPGTMSGGERQRVAIARALCQRPRALLCDEPTGNLDEENSEKIIDLLTAVHRGGFTVIVVTHDSSIAKRMPRQLHVQDGIVTDVSA
jgi:putative ABC transport system ATP-binding protein